MSGAGAQLAAVGTIVAILAGIWSVLLMARQSKRETEKAHRQEVADAVKEATDPIREDLRNMTNERNYWRDRAGAYEDELRRRQP